MEDGKKKKKNTNVKEWINSLLRKKHTKNVIMIIFWVFFVVATFYAINYLLSGVLLLVLGRQTLNNLADNTLFYMIISAVVYGATILAILLVPYYVKKTKISRAELGLKGLPTWTDILLSPAGFIVYMIIAMIFMLITTVAMPWVDTNQAQDIGIARDSLIGFSDYLFAFITLVVVAPIVEEVMFRGFLYGKIRKHTGAVIATIIVSVVFGAMHGQWNAAINICAMSIVMCFLREVTGTIYSGILLHMIKNGIAFYLLYVGSSSMIGMIGG